jgi:hypothetical protein
MSHTFTIFKDQISGHQEGRAVMSTFYLLSDTKPATDCKKVLILLKEVISLQ